MSIESVEARSLDNSSQGKSAKGGGKERDDQNQSLNERKEGEDELSYHCLKGISDALLGK